jgi:fructose-bisphosphate aldolase class II
MTTLREYLKEAAASGRALGHFNFSDSTTLTAIIRAAGALKVPVLAGVSEGEGEFVGLEQAAALVKSWHDLGQPVFLNADHSYSFERVKAAVAAGFDAVIIDGGALPFEENLALTKKVVEYVRATRPEVIVEGEIGYIGKSSTLLDNVPTGAAQAGGGLTTPEQAKRFVAETGVDLLAPAVGNIHGMLKSQPEPRLDISLIKEIRQAAGVPLVLHGASGNSEEDIRAAVAAGVAIVHINTELRLAYRTGLRAALQDNPDEVAPYKILRPALTAMQKLVEQKLRLL